jgi:LysR family hydrogen peroxide-inducible transcriptional activator
VSVLPATALQKRYLTKLVKEVPFTSPVPSRKVALAWRQSFGRKAAVELLAEAITGVKLPALRMAKVA